MDKTFLQYRKTYNAGLLQAKAFRILKKHTNTALQSVDISATEWGILGLLVNNPKGLRFSKIAVMLGVKAPFVTNSMIILAKKKLLVINTDTIDTRVKIATLNDTGRDFLKKTEPIVAKEIKRTFNGTSLRNLYGYVATLHGIVETYGADIENIDLSHLAD